MELLGLRPAGRPLGARRRHAVARMPGHYHIFPYAVAAWLILGLGVVLFVPGRGE